MKSLLVPHATEIEVLCTVATPMAAGNAEGWRPGLPVVSKEDHAAWSAWRATRRREQQRARRAASRRFDYYASPAVARALESLWRPTASHDFSTIIDRAIRAGLELPPE